MIPIQIQKAQFVAEKEMPHFIPAQCESYSKDSNWKDPENSPIPVCAIEFNRK